MKALYYIIFTFWYLLSFLPFKVLYALSDIIYGLVYHIVGYRRKIVRKNLTTAYPDKDAKEIDGIEKEFYHFLCDYFVETVKLMSIKKEKLMERMTFGGIEEMEKNMEQKDKLFCFVYLGHYGNWEWIASLPYWAGNDTLCAQIYHPLRNKAFDELFLKIRNRFGGESIPMKSTLRRIIQLKQKRQRTIIGFISDQLPKWNSIHHFSPFMNKETAVFIGTEQIGKQVDAMIYYADVTRPKRGYYHCEFKKITDEPKQFADFTLTDIYMNLLQEMINAKPYLWLWSHDRWKRTKEEWIERQEKENK